MLNGEVWKHVLLIIRYFSVAEFTAVTQLSVLGSYKHNFHFKNVSPH